MNEVKRVGEIIHLSADFLHSHKIDRAKREAEDLLALVLRKKRLELYLEFERPLTPDEMVEMRELLKKRVQGIPFGYLAKQMAFYGLLLEITPAVLVPRPESELLIERIIGLLSKEELEGRVLWDLCTGSGCLGLSLKKAFPKLQVILSDISGEALALAQKNAKHNHLEVTICQGDLFAPFSGMKCDFFLCNPPYLSEADYLASSVELKHEPKLALVAPEEGYSFYKRIAKELPTYLNANGKVFLEIGASQGQDIKNIFKDWDAKEMRVENDLAGHSRFFFLE